MSIDATQRPLAMRGCDPVIWHRVSGQLTELLILHFGLVDVSLSPESRFDEDLALDSLDLVDFGVVITDQYEIELDLSVLRLVRTVGDMISLISAALEDRTRQSEA